MKLSKKIQLLRKEREYSQEQLAELCNVSRQTISKWETDVTLPDQEKIMVLSDVFQVSTDILLKEELHLNSIANSSHCGLSIVQQRKKIIYEGILIKESIDNEDILDYLKINKVEIWKTEGVPKYWTVLHFTSSYEKFPQLISKVVIANEKVGNWFVDFKCGNKKYIIFRNKVLKYTIGNQREKKLVCDECRQMGISDKEMNWPE